MKTTSETPKSDAEIKALNRLNRASNSIARQVNDNPYLEIDPRTQQVFNEAYDELLALGWTRRDLFFGKRIREANHE
jgi:hypothetical protein